MMTQSTDSIIRQVRGENRMTTVNSIMAQENTIGKMMQTVSQHISVEMYRKQRLIFYFIRQ